MLNDLRYAGRGLRRNPGFTIVALVTLALGVGSTTAVFSVVYGVLLRPLPFPHADRVVEITELSPSQNPADPYRGGLTPQQVQTWRDRSKTTSQIGLYEPTSATLTGPHAAARLVGAEVSAALFAALGVRPMRGRTFIAEDEQLGSERVVILSHETWASRTGSDDSIIGRRLMLDDRPHRVVGVMPRGFGFPSVAGSSAPLNSEGRHSDAPEYWVPIVPQTGVTHVRSAIALLRPGVSVEEAVVEGSMILTPDKTYGPPPPRGFRYAEVVTLGESIGRDVRPVLLLFQSGVVLVLLIACANVINLLLARGAHRRGELSVRAALGATRRQLIRYAVCEAMLLALGGGALGSVLAYAAIDVIRRLPPHLLPRLSEIHVDMTALAFAWALSIAVGVAVGLIAALRTIRRDLWRFVHAGGRGTSGGAGRQRPSRALVVGQIAAAMVLLAGAGLLLRTFTRLMDVKPGVKPDGVVTFRVGLSEARYPTPAIQNAFSDTLLEHLRALPGVESAGLSTDGSVIGSSAGSSLRSIDGAPIPMPDPGSPNFSEAVRRSMAWTRYVSEGFFETLGVPILRGRVFTTRDRGRGVAVVSDAFAHLHFSQRDPVGRHIGFGGDLEIVGVVGNVRSSPTIEPGAEIYLLPADSEDPFHRSKQLVAFIRSSRNPFALVPSVRQTLSQLDPQLAAYDVKSMNQFLDRSFVSPRFYGLVSTVFAAIALTLAAIGLYGVLAYSVETRRREFGVRMALGGQARNMVLGVMREGLALSIAGVVLGMVGAYYGSRVLETLLFGVTPHDATTFVAASLLFVVVGAIACYVPARRATRVDPIVALRCE